ncbi:MAG: hypothetical protein AB8H86_14275 [Polyangiales bacterium]
MLVRALVVVCSTLFLVSCEGEISEAPRREVPEGPEIPDFPEDPTRPGVTQCEAFDATGAHSYGAKVKNLIVGLPLTGEELAALQDDPRSLEMLISTWLETPEASAKLRDFFAMAFQQEGFEEAGLTEQWAEPDIRTGHFADEETIMDNSLRENFETSFARTVVQFVNEGRPFHQVVTTRSFMMTTAMMTAMAFADERHRLDNGNAFFRSVSEVMTNVEFQNLQAYPQSQVLDPASPNFLRFYAETSEIVPTCSGGSVTYEGTNTPLIAFRSMFGYFARLAFSGCTGEGRPNWPAPSLFSREDFRDWRLVEVRAPSDDEETTRFYDLESIRGGTTLVTHAPRVGFFTTPAFFAVWQTNEDNAHRVTANQTLITAFGNSIDESQSIIPTRDSALDAEHADPSTGCWHCHKTLDPMRQIFRQEYTLYSNAQLDEEERAIPAAFAWDGVTAEPDTIYEFAEVIATHPNFARGWVQKLCFYANSRECPDDPDDESDAFDEVVRAFVESDYDFKTLVRTLFSSSLVTNAECIQGSTGDNAGISRTRHFCAALSHRLGMDDVCGQRILLDDDRIPLREANAPLVSTLPNDTFSRGGQNPLTVSDINLFVRATYERICANAAAEFVGDDALISPSDEDASLTFLTERLMGFPEGDPRHDTARSILQGHLEEARLAPDITEVLALQSTFTLACLSPSLIGVGL